MIFRKANAGELEAGSGLMDLFENMTEIDVEKEGVKGAKNFFQAKVSYKDNYSHFLLFALYSIKGLNFIHVCLPDLTLSVIVFIIMQHC